MVKPPKSSFHLIDLIKKCCKYGGIAASSISNTYIKDMSFRDELISRVAEGDRDEVMRKAIDLAKSSCSPYAHCLQLVVNEYTTKIQDKSWAQNQTE